MLSSLKVPECRRITYFSRFEQHPTTAHLQKSLFSVCEWVQILPSVCGSRFGLRKNRKARILLMTATLNLKLCSLGQSMQKTKNGLKLLSLEAFKRSLN